MRYTKLTIAAIMLLVITTTLQAQHIVTTVAGGGPHNLPATSANVFGLKGVATDGAGNVYYSSTIYNRIYKINPAGMLTVVAGTMGAGFAGDGGLATDATLTLDNMSLDQSGNIFIPNTNSVRRVDAQTGIITTVAGSTIAGFSGDGGDALGARFKNIARVAFDAAGNLYILDRGNNRVRRVDAATGIVNTIAGNGIAGFSGDGGPAINASINSPDDVEVDAAGNVFITDRNNHRIRRVDMTTGIITTVAGKGTSGVGVDGVLATTSSVSSPLDAAFDNAGNLLIVDSTRRIRRVDMATGIITTVAGNGVSCVDNALLTGEGGAATSASLCKPVGVAVDPSGNLIIADNSNCRIRRVDATTGIITTLAGNGTFQYSGDGFAATSGSLAFVPGIATDCAGNLYVADNQNSRVRRIDAATGILSTVAGTGNFGLTGDGGPATGANFVYPYDVAVDAAGNLFIADYQNSRVRRVDAATGVVTTYAGGGYWNQPNDGDGGLATNAYVPAMYKIAADSVGNLYISAKHRVRKVNAATGIITTVAGNGYYYSGYGPNGDGGPAIGAPLAANGLAIDKAGNLYIAGEYCVRRVDAVTGIITTVAGTGQFGYAGDGGPATSARVGTTDVAFDKAGNLLILGDNRIRRVDAVTGVITTIAGKGTLGFSGDGGSALNASFAQPYKMALDAQGNIYIADMNNRRIRKVANRAPTANAGSDQTLESASAAGSQVTVDGSASLDADGDQLSYEWRQGSTLLGTSAHLSTNLPLGSHTLTLTVKDSFGIASEDAVTINVVDTTAPAIVGAATDKTVLGTPNHKMVDVLVSYETTDAVSAVSSSLGVTSNEAVNENSDGNTTPDWEVVDAHHVRLRAERAGGGDGRVYTITITATDAAGNSSTRSVAVSVPKN